MQRFWRIIAGFPFMLLTACVAFHTGGHQAGTLRPAVDRLLSRGDVQVAETHCCGLMKTDTLIRVIR
jgi:hypothetical protein